MASPLVHEKVWLEKCKYDEAERQYFERLAKLHLSKGMSLPRTTAVNAVKSEPKIVESRTDSSKCKTVSSTPNTQHLHKGLSSQPALVDAVKTEVKTVECHINSSKAKTPSSIPITQVKISAEPNNVNGVDAVSQLKGKKLKYRTPEEKRKSRYRNKTPEEREQLRLKNKKKGSPSAPLKNSLAGEVAKARQHIKNSLECMDGIAALATNVNVDLVNRMNSLENIVKDLQSAIQKLDSRVKVLEVTASAGPRPVPSAASAPKPTPSKAQVQDDEDDGVDLFASDSEDEADEAKKLKEQRLAEYAAKKSKKPALVAKSSIILEVKPWDDETDMKEMEAEVRKIEMDGLVWGASKLVPLAYGIHKLQITCVVEDDKVSVDLLQESIEAIENHVQSVDIAAFNKI